MDEGEALMVRGFLGGVEGVREIWFREGGVVMRVRASRLRDPLGEWRAC